MDTQLKVTGWYYVQNGERTGPVEESEFETLVRAGTIMPDTLVWHDGMADWRPYSEFAPTEPAEGTQPDRQVEPGLFRVPCDRCGQVLQADQLVHIGGVAICPACRTGAVQSLKKAGDIKGSAEPLRKSHLGHETAVKQAGFLLVLAGLLVGFNGISSVVSGQQKGTVPGLPAVILAAVQITVGVGLNRLRPWSRIAAAALCGLYILSGLRNAADLHRFVQLDNWSLWLTLFHIGILYLLFSKKGSMVFSAPYRKVITATPHVRQGISTITIIVVVFFLFCVILAVGVIVVTRR